MSNTLLGKLLVWNKIITQEQLEEALKEQKISKKGKKLGEILVEKGYITEEALRGFLSKQYNIQEVDLSSIEISPEVINKVPAQLVKKHSVIPVAVEGDSIKVATSDPANIFVFDEIRFVTGLKVVPVLASEKSIQNAIDKYYGSSKEISVILENLQASKNDVDIVMYSDTDEISDIEDLKNQSSKEPIINLANSIIKKAVEVNASDIHVENFEKVLRVRLRVDGKLRTIMEHPKNIAPALISRLKIMSKLDIAEKRLPQDGRIRLRVGGKDIDFRVSTLPTVFGENMVLRILDRSNVRMNLNSLGFEDFDLRRYMEAIQAPYGMILNTGPTGSGKTTTLYASLNVLNKEGVNILTVEDPVEYNIHGISQVQVKEDIGLTFSQALRTFLRQDPDIIMVGEIRDTETAEIAIKSALTGHLVLSTLHTNDAPSSIVRLVNMGIERYLIASSVILVLAQRLVRRICTHCKERIDVPVSSLVDVGFGEEEAKNIQVYKGKGCEYCDFTGYRGRVAIYEVMPITDTIREMILSGASTDELKEQAIKEGMSTLRKSGLKKIKEGITTLEEVVSITFV